MGDVTATQAYNLGTQALGQNPATARANLELAHALNPFDQDTNYNLYIAKQQLLGSTPLHASSEGLQALVFQIYSPPTPAFIATLPPYLLRTSGCVIALVSAIFFARLIKLRGQISIPSLIAFFLGCLLFFIEATSLSTARGYSTTPLSIRSGPGDQFSELGIAPPGGELLIHHESNEWVQITFAPDQFGWVKKSALLLLPQ